MRKNIILQGTTKDGRFMMERFQATLLLEFSQKTGLEVYKLKQRKTAHQIRLGLCSQVQPEKIRYLVPISPKPFYRSNSLDILARHCATLYDEMEGPSIKVPEGTVNNLRYFDTGFDWNNKASRITVKAGCTLYASNHLNMAEVAQTFKATIQSDKDYLEKDLGFYTQKDLGNNALSSLMCFCNDTSDIGEKQIIKKCT